MGSANACIYLVMGFGALLALIGVFLSTRGEPQGRSSLKFYQFEFQLAGSPLVIFVVGCILIVIPLVAGDKLAGLFAEEEPEDISLWYDPTGEYATEDDKTAAYPTGYRPAQDGPQLRDPTEVVTVDGGMGGDEIVQPDTVEPDLAEPGTVDEDTTVRDAWRMAQAERGPFTTAREAANAFGQVVLSEGSLGVTYALDLDGKDGIDRFSIRVVDEYSEELRLLPELPGVDLIYKKYECSLEAGGVPYESVCLASKVVGSDDPWEEVGSEQVGGDPLANLLQGIFSLP